MPKVSKKESSKGTTDVKPKGRKTAYSIFVQTCRDEHRKKNPNANVNFAEFSKACSERWNKMSDKEKGRFKGLADKVSARNHDISSSRFKFTVLVWTMNHRR